MRDRHCGLARLSLQGRTQALFGEQRRVDARGREPGGRRAQPGLDLCSSGVSCRTEAASSADCSSRPSWMERATSCCWAPSCRLRSIFRRSSSCAPTSRRREAFSSSIVACSSAVSRPLRKTSPAWEARCCRSLSSVWVSDSFLGFCRASAPSSSSPCRTATARDAVSNGGSCSPSARGSAAPGGDPPGQIVTGRSSGPTRIQASRPDGAGGAGQDGHHLGHRLVVVELPGHVVSEVGQHLVGRGPLARTPAGWRSGGPAAGRVGTAGRPRRPHAIVSTGLSCCPASVPMPSTIPAYTAVSPAETRP